MKIYGEKDQLITDPDLEVGELRQETRIKPDAVPIDNKTKHAWDDDDYEDILRYHVWTQDELAGIAKRKAETAKAEAREAFLESAPDIQAEQDAAICDLYEQTLNMQAESDQAITDLYEMILEVQNG